MAYYHGYKHIPEGSSIQLFQRIHAFILLIDSDVSELKISCFPTIDARADESTPKIINPLLR